MAICHNPQVADLGFCDRKNPISGVWHQPLGASTHRRHGPSAGCSAYSQLCGEQLSELGLGFWFVVGTVLGGGEPADRDVAADRVRLGVSGLRAVRRLLASRVLDNKPAPSRSPLGVSVLTSPVVAVLGSSPVPASMQPSGYAHSSRRHCRVLCMVGGEAGASALWGRFWRRRRSGYRALRGRSERPPAGLGWPGERLVVAHRRARGAIRWECSVLWVGPPRCGGVGSAPCVGAQRCYVRVRP